MTDQEKLVSLLEEFGIEYKIWTDREFIMAEALSDGAVLSIDVRGMLEFAFKKNGELTGTFDESKGSYKKHRDVEKIQSLLKMKKESKED